MATIQLKKYFKWKKGFLKNGDDELCGKACLFSRFKRRTDERCETFQPVVRLCDASLARCRQFHDSSSAQLNPGHVQQNHWLLHKPFHCSRGHLELGSDSLHCGGSLLGWHRFANFHFCVQVHRSWRQWLHSGWRQRSLRCQRHVLRPLCPHHFPARPLCEVPRRKASCSGWRWRRRTGKNVLLREEASFIVEPKPISQ